MSELTMERFLQDQSLTADCYDLDAEIQRFQQEMTAGLSGEKSSLFMIPTFISPEAAELTDETLIVLDAGGTNLRVGYVTFKGGKADEVVFEKCPLPGTDKALTCDEFFDAVAEKLAPYLNAGNKIGFCFSYAAQCMENRDAKMVAFCKEVKVTGAEGVEICKALDAAIHRRGVEQTYSYVQLNDTVATQLGGMAATDRSKYDGYIGFILGTGINGCYTEATANIPKYTGTAYTDPTMIVNMEAGCYAGFSKGAVDYCIDGKSAIPGDHQAEKMMSGAYLGRIIAEALKVASKARILETDLSHVEKIHMVEINRFLAGESNEIDSFLCDSDRGAVKMLIESVYRRTARLMAVMFAAVAIHSDIGKVKPVCVVLEGSTYQKSPVLQEFLMAELETVLQTYGRRFEVISAENPTLTGSAFAAAANL